MVDDRGRKWDGGGGNKGSYCTKVTWPQTETRNINIHAHIPQIPLQSQISLTVTYTVSVTRYQLYTKYPHTHPSVKLCRNDTQQMTWTCVNSTTSSEYQTLNVSTNQPHTGGIRPQLTIRTSPLCDPSQGRSFAFYIRPVLGRMPYWSF